MQNLFVFSLFLLSGMSLLATSDSRPRDEVERFENVVLANTLVRKIHSNVTKQDYRILVNVPASYYSEPNKKYPALFTLDADYSFALAKQITEHLSDRNHIPEMFVFSIAYDGPPQYRINRTRDYTPTRVLEGGYGADFQKHSGGGPAFAEFIEKELKPYLRRAFRLSENSALVGHSFGGLFSAWALITRPSLFDSYICVSPSLWYDKSLVLRLAERASNFGNRPLKIFLAVGSKESPAYGTTYDLVKDLRDFTAILRDKKSEALVLDSETFQNESHDTVFPGALTRGIPFVFGKRNETALAAAR